MLSGVDKYRTEDRIVFSCIIVRNLSVFHWLLRYNVIVLFCGYNKLTKTTQNGVLH